MAVVERITSESETLHSVECMSARARFSENQLLRGLEVLFSSLHLQNSSLGFSCLNLKTINISIFKESTPDENPLSGTINYRGLRGTGSRCDIVWFP